MISRRHLRHDSYARVELTSLLVLSMTSMTVQPKTESRPAMTIKTRAESLLITKCRIKSLPDMRSHYFQFNTKFENSPVNLGGCSSTRTALLQLQSGLWLLLCLCSKLKSTARLCSRLELCHKHFPWQMSHFPMTLGFGGTTHELNREGGSSGTGNETRYSASVPSFE